MLVLAVCLGLFSTFTVLVVRFFYLKVQCWFCGHTAFTSWSRKTSFVCQQCGQYNGFKSDGDYNKVIPSQFIAELNPVNFNKVRSIFTLDLFRLTVRFHHILMYCARTVHVIKILLSKSCRSIPRKTTSRMRK